MKTGRPTIYTGRNYWYCVKNTKRATARTVADILGVTRETALIHLKECADAGKLTKEMKGTEYIFSAVED